MSVLLIEKKKEPAQACRTVVFKGWLLFGSQELSSMDFTVD